MAVDLKSMTKKELEKLGRDVEKALQRIQKQEVKKVRQEMQKLAASHGLTMEDVLTSPAPSKKSTKAKTKAAPKYANPSDASQTWTGKGRQPEWFKAAIAAGASPDSMAI